MTTPRPPEYKVKQAEAQRKRRQANPEKYREINKGCERNRKIKKYGLTLESYNEMFSKQNQRCGICETTTLMGRNWHIDHDHATGKVRGLLCHHCNLMLGNARDNIKILQAGINYLTKNNV